MFEINQTKDTLGQQMTQLVQLDFYIEIIGNQSGADEKNRFLKRLYL